MNKTVKLILGAVVVVIVALGIGWLWGASGRWAEEARLRDAELRVDLSTAIAALYAARVDVFELNFGQASRDLETAKKGLNDASGRLTSAGQQEAVSAVREALAKATEAQHLAGRVDQSANSRAAEAIKALARISPLK